MEEDKAEVTGPPATSADSNYSSRSNERLGKRLAYLLRYGAEREGIQVMSDGFVPLSDLIAVPLLAEHSESDILDEVKNSISMRGVPRFELKDDRHRHRLLVRATYGRRFERFPYHAGTRVRRLLDQTIDFIAKHITDYDFEEFSDDYMLNVIMTRLKRQRKLTSKALRCFLVPALEHLDLWSVFVNEATLRLVPKRTPCLKFLSLRDCGYIVTDHLLTAMLKGLPLLESLNLTGCHHVTDCGLATTVKYCGHLQHLNLTFLKNITEAGVLNVVEHCSCLTELNMYDFKRFSNEGLEKVYALTQGKPFRLEITGVTSTTNEKGQIYDSAWERLNFR